MPEISIIVPVYNVEKYLEKCLESLLNQTFSDIEIICIEDASTDTSMKIIDSYAERDKRVHIIKHQENIGTLLARKHGVEYATGTYIMFLDGDDWLETVACEKLYETMLIEQVDILQYGTNVIPAVSLSEEMVKWVENFLEPFEQKIEGKDILRLCFVEDKFDFNITDKIWKTDICKEAFAMLGHQKMVAAEDRYIFFVLAYYAQSYLGIGDSKYYNYNVGIGITGGDVLCLERFEKRCMGVMAVDAVAHFLKDKNEVETYQLEYAQFENKILWDCVDCWHNKLEQQNYGTGYDILLKYWTPSKVLSAISRVYFEQEEDIWSRVKNSEKVSYEKVVGIYYRYLGYEPMNSYIKNQIEILQKTSKKILLFTDADAEMQNICDWNMQIISLLPSKDANWDNYRFRSEQLAQKIEEHNINYMFYASPTSHIAWLDILLLESSGVQVFCMNEEAAIEESGRWKRSEGKIQQFIDEHPNSKMIRIGAAVLWSLKKLKSIIVRQSD